MSELFRNYVVCFVGYSINDPVLRYMMDALAADRMLGEVTPQAWALGDCETGQEHLKAIEWEAKGVTPILYEVPPAVTIILRCIRLCNPGQNLPRWRCRAKKPSSSNTHWLGHRTAPARRFRRSDVVGLVGQIRPCRPNASPTSIPLPPLDWLRVLLRG